MCLRFDKMYSWKTTKMKAVSLASEDLYMP